jgi:hypothetical protein
MAARLAANSGERTSMLEAILAIVIPVREAQNCRTIRLSNDSGSEDNGVEP